MKNLTLNNIAAAVGGQLHIAGRFSQTAEAASVVIDSRKAEEGSVFVATVGEKVDGHSFIRQVFEKGALGVICEKEPENPAGPWILVKNSFDALKKIAAYYMQQLDVKTVGIVGSVGKTSTKELVAAVLSEHYNVLKTDGNLNNEVGVPLTVLRIRDEHELAVIEMGISNFGEMSRLGEIVRPDAVVMTNIGPCHLEFLGDLDGVLKAKSEVFAYIKEGGKLFLNSDDEHLGKVSCESANALRPAGAGKIELCYYGSHGESRAENVVSHGLMGSSFGWLLDSKAGKTGAELTVPLPGAHMVSNALAAAYVGAEFGLSAQEIAAGIASVKPVSGRSNLIQTDRWLLVDDCYNANPKSMAAAIDLMKDALGRRVAILGDMFELGPDENELHAGVGEYAVKNGIDLLVCVGKLSKYMYEAACAAAENCEAQKKPRILSYGGREELLGKLDEIGLADGDTILIKASHGMGFTAVVDVLRG